VRRRTFIWAGSLLAAVMTGSVMTPSLAAAAPGPDLAAVQVSADPYANAAAIHATEVEPDTVTVGHSVMSVFQVGRWDNGCSDDTGWALSTNAGRTWRHGYLPGLTKFSHPAGPFTRASDPVVAYNAAAGEWIASSLACNGTSPSPRAPVASPAVVVNVSFDGVHWSKAIVVARVTKGQAFDKDWIACDNSVTSRYYGHCYVEWDVPSQGELVQMSTSRDGGFTWSPGTATRSRLHGIGGEPIVQPNGDVVVPILGFNGIVDFRSVNGGRTWGPTIKLAGIFQHTFGGELRGPFFPSVAMDHSGKIYVSWPDCRFRPDCASNDMVLTTSTDGVHWTRVTRIPIAGGYMIGDYEGAGIVPGGRAFSAFAVGGIPAAGQHDNEAMYAPSGGAPVTGGPLPASAAGARAFSPARPPLIAH
jgi:hypothetical protein